MRVCYNCLRGRPDRCINTGDAQPGVIGYPEDGGPVTQQHDRGGFAELVIAPEDYRTPISHDISAVELAMLGCPAACGLGCTLGFVAPVTAGCDVCVLGCGPLGLSAIQGARIKGDFNGVATLKDMQIFARLVERGQFNAKAVAAATFPLERTKDALQLVSDRTTIAAIPVFG